MTVDVGTITGNSKILGGDESEFNGRNNGNERKNFLKKFFVMKRKCPYIPKHKIPFS